MNIKAWYLACENALSGWPDAILTLSLVISGTVVILIGLFAPRTVKLITLAWVWFP